MGKSVRDPVTPDDLFSDMKGVEDPFFGSVHTREISTKGVSSPKDSEYVHDVTPFDDSRSLQGFNAELQPWQDIVSRTGKQFLANVTSSIGQGLANTFDVVSNLKTAKGLVNGTNDDFDSSLFGLSTRDMQDWANGIVERNQIYEKNQGSFNPNDAGWWGKEIASTGTGIGMGIEALAETAAIEYATGGLGTGAAITKLVGLGKKILSGGAKGAEILSEAISATKGMKSAATVYGVMSRLNESRMEATNSYDDIVQTLSKEKDEHGARKYSDDEVKHLASEGARRDYAWNIALLPLDILSYRTMVFNPISGSGTGAIEKGLESIAGVFGKSTLGKAAGWTTEKLIAHQFEGLEEGFQQVGQDEGRHYANVLGGVDDGSNFAQRLGQDVQTDEFWNNYAGGVLGSPVIAGAMNLVNKITTGNRSAEINAAHKYYIQQVGKMDNAMATQIRELEENGQTDLANLKRRQFGALKALSALHLDASTDRDTAFESRMTFLEGTLGELNEGKTDALGDLGFFNIDPKNIPKLKEEFQNYVDDAKDMKGIYDYVKTKYNKNFVPAIALDHFNLEKLNQQQVKVDLNLAEEKKKLNQYELLSSHGRDIYDTEFQLTAINHEKERLNKLLITTEDKHEKENIVKLIDQNNNKLIEVKNTLASVQADEAYTPINKEVDNDIINSTLRSKDYLQAMYDKVHLENEISLQRKKIALWNNPEYINNKVQQSVVRSKTKQQLRNNIAPQANVTPEIANTVKEKENEIEAADAAEDIDEVGSYGNQDLFAEDNEHLNNIKANVIPSSLVVNKTGTIAEQEQIDKDWHDRWAKDEEDWNELKNSIDKDSFEPKVYDFNKSSDEAKNNVKEGVKGLLNSLGEQASFEDLVRHIIDLQGKEVADQTFNAIKYGWEANGKTPVDYDAIYRNIFANPMDRYKLGISQLLVQGTEQITDDVVAQGDKPKGFDENNQPRYVYTSKDGGRGYVTNESSPKMAFVTIASNLITTPQDDNVIQVTHEYSDEELNQSEYVDSNQLLDPDKWNEGTEAEIRIPTNFNNINIPIFGSDGKKVLGVKKTFGQYVSENNLSPESQEYKDKIPMIIYRRGAPISEKGVSFVHDIGWYHPLRFNQDKPEDMIEAINSTRAIRQEVINNPNKKSNIEVTNKRQTTFEGLKVKTPITLREANPQTQVTVVAGDGADLHLRDTKKNIVFPNNESRLVNTKPFLYNGQVIEVRRYGKDENGVNTYIGLPVTEKRINEEAISSIVQAITIYDSRKFLTPQQQAVVDHIKTTMGTNMDITASPSGGVANGLKLYLSHFFRIYDPNRSSTNQEIERQAKVDLAYGTPYLAFIDGGNIVFGQAGKPIYVDKNKLETLVKGGMAEAEATEQAKVYSYYINPSTAKTSLGLQHLNEGITTNKKNGDIEKTTRIGWYEQGVSLDAMAADKPVVTIAKDYTTKVASNSYKDYLLDNLTSDIKSINIGTDKNPNYVTNIQPIITYDSTNRINTQRSQPTNNQIKEEVVHEEVKKDTTEPVGKTLDDILKEELAKARSKLGNDVGMSNRLDSDSFEPKLLEDSQRVYISKSIDRIAGLNSAQQSTVTSFIFNQITGLVNLENTSVTKSDVDKQVEKVFDDIMIPEREDAQSEANRLKQLITDHPELKDSVSPDTIKSYNELLDRIKDYQLRVAIIDSIKNNFSTLQNIAYEKVKKNTGITQNKQLLEREEGENEYADNDATRATDFGKDILTESPENKLTYSMRRFFGQTRQYDKEGNPMQGFLNLPLYEDSSAIIRSLMTTLVDVPANFKDMMAKLEEQKDSKPWMHEIISRLNAGTQQRKNQFVTVMHNTSLRMKFSMIGFDRFRNEWNVKLMDSTTNGIAGTVKKMWNSNLFGDSDFKLAIVGAEGNLILNKDKAESLIHRFEDWTGIGVKSIEANTDELKIPSQQVNTGKPITVDNLSTPLLKELRANIVKAGDRMKFSISGRPFQITQLSNGKYQIAFISNSASNPQVIDWLREFGIIVSPKTIDVMRSGQFYHNYDKRIWADQFETGKSNGLFGILYEHLKGIVNTEGGFDFTDSGNNPLDNSVITSLANEEAKHSDIQSIFGFRVAGKSYFALVAPSFISDRARDLKDKDGVVRDQLEQISFSSPSMILNLLKDQNFRDKYQVTDDSAESLKQTGKKSYKDASIGKLSDSDHELTKVTKFQDMTQGEVRYGKQGLNVYPDTGIPFRMSTMFGLTMSDKDRMKLFTTAVLNLSNTHLEKGVDPEVLKVLYDQTVKPELLRMSKHASSNGNNTNISEYDKGAAIFLMVPEMNNILVNPNLKLVDAIKHQPNKFTTTYIENNKELKADINKVLKEHIDQLVEDKLKVWDKFTTKKEDGSIDSIKFFDKKYLSKFSGTKAEQLKMAAMDYEINTLVANANNFMLFAGDPAMYYKSNALDYIQQAKDTFTNINKRLANQVAPGVTIPDSDGEKYLQIFMNDRKATANDIEYLEGLLGKEGAAPYRDIKLSDAQEYTTWKEHLDILNRLGKSADFMFDITPEEIAATRALMSSGIPKKELSPKQLEMILKVMQPIKPVYTGQVYDKDQDVMRTMYIKSSSFPLIPQLTAGLEIDKLRARMEQIQDRTKQNVRASYQSANKVGALNISSSIKMWNDDGTINTDTLKDLSKYTLPLDRKNFRIQQEVPFKSDRVKEDTVTLGTQLMKLLFGDEVMNETGFMFDGKEKTGKELHQQYTDAFINLIKEKQNQLYSELGLNENGIPTDINASMNKLQGLLEDEAKKRSYPLQDIKGLEIDPITGNFKMPLWASSNSNRYESMLNAIVSKRMVSMKFPGSSFVTGSEEGFRIEKEGRQDKSGIIYTSAFDGVSLQPNQVFMPSKFRGHGGELLDLMTQKDGKYVYINETDEGFKLNEKMFDKQLLDNLTFRIPTSGHQSGSLITIAGFLPHTTGDLIIVSKNAVIQKGLDFDVDKENAYQLWTHIAKDGKLKVLSEDDRDDIIAQADKLKESNDEAANKFFDDIFGKDTEYTPEEVNSSDRLKRTNSRITEKLLHNEIIKITHSVYANPSKTMQAKIARTLSTKYAEDQANMIEGLINQSKPNRLWTPLSSEHQKQTLISGVGGKTGTGAYSLDVTFHSLAQQANANSTPIEFHIVYSNEAERTGEDERGNAYTKDFTKWKFGTIESDGILGKAKTLDGGRNISEVMSERQNIAVDNSSLQVMGKVNLNGITLDVDKVFNLLGIDKGSDGNSIPFLFMSQPIIREYVEQMKNANSIMADYEEAKEQKIIDGLLKKYDIDTKEENIDNDYWETMSNEMTNPNMITALSSENPDGKLQGAILRRFIEMKQYGQAIRGIQTSINFSSNSFGKSFFDVIEKKNQLNKLGNNSVVKLGGKDIGVIDGQNSLIGKYYSKDLYNEAPEGTIDIGDFFVRPTTVMGGFNIHATMTAYNLWNKHFPYDTNASQAVFDEILGIVGNPDMGSNRTVDTKQDIFKDIRRYLAASQMNGVINNTDDVNKERYRLYIDNDTNTSLPKYLKTIMQIQGNNAIETYIKTNKLLNRFEFDTDKTGKPSKIRYNNAAGEEFDEQYLYESLSMLLEPHGKTGRVQLPTVGNKSYTLDSLAQDLIAYSLLGNAVQEAIQFTKYIPVAYLNTVGYSEWLTENTDTLGIKPTSGTEGFKHLVSEFTMQYVQHNPGAVKYRLTNDNFLGKIIENNSSTLNNLETFKLRTPEKPTYISIYNSFLPKGENKYQLYWFDGDKYSRVPVLGIFGMDEYQQGHGTGTSIVNNNVKVKATPQVEIKHIDENPEDIFDVNSKDLVNILKKVEDYGIEGFSQLAKVLSPYIGATKIMYTSPVETEGMRAAFSHSDNEIYINADWFKQANSWQMARTILHETIHSLTTNQIKPYINQEQDGSVTVNNNAPSYVSELVRLYNDVRAKNDTKELQDVLKKVKSGQSLSQEEYNTKYGLTNIYEFMAMTSHPDFLNYLASNQFKQSGQTFRDRFIEIVKTILNKLGVKYESDTAAAHLVNNLFEFIDQESKKSTKDIYKKMAEDAMNEGWDEDQGNQDFLKRLDEGFDEGDTGNADDSFEPFPKKDLDIKEEKCI